MRSLADIPGDPPTPNPVYPCIKYSYSGRIVLFKGHNIGVTIGWTRGSSPWDGLDPTHEIGETSTFIETLFQMYYGTVRLSNE